MTLVARQKPPAHHKKVSGAHHRQSKSYHKAYWPYLPLLAIVLVGGLLNSVWPAKHSVLGYATDMSVQSLLDDTNNQRTSNSLAALNLNAQLDTAAQNKANDMAARDYWSHDTPDGQAPWTFITAAGYNYQAAGENLAYGFDTAANTITGWMNSPEHRANILNGTYQDVGFGIANSADYQGSGPETIIVAEYATPTRPAVAAATPPVSSSTPTTAPTSQPAPAAASQSTPTPSTTSAAIATTTPAAASPSSASASVETKATSEPAPQKISRVELLTAGNASWSMLATTLIVVIALLIFLMRHAIAWHKVIKKGERFVLKHQLFDIIAISLATIGFILTRTSGIIR